MNFEDCYFMVLNPTKSVKVKTGLLGRKHGCKIPIIGEATGGI